MEVHFFSEIDGQLIQYKSKASLNNNVLSFYECLDENKNLVNVFINDKTIRIIRDGEISSNFLFELAKETKAVYETKYGSSDFLIYTKKLNITKNKIFISYETIFDKKNASNVKIWLIIK